MNKKILVALAIGVLCFSTSQVLAQPNQETELGPNEELEIQPVEETPTESEIPPVVEEDDGNIIENVEAEMPLPEETELIETETIIDQEDNEEVVVEPPVEESDTTTPPVEEISDGTVIVDETLNGNILATSALAALAALLVI